MAKEVVYLQTLLSGLDRGDISGHAATDDDQVLLLCPYISHCSLLY